MSSKFVAVPLLALGLCLAPGARAQGRDPAAADALFKQGRAAMDARDYATACAKFYESNRLDPAIGTVFNIADCEERRGNVATAWARFQEVAQQLPANDDRRPIALARRAALEQRLPRLAVRLTDGAPGAVVQRDDVALGAASLGTPLPVDPGEHVVRVSAPGRRDAVFRVTLAEGEQRALDVTVGASAPSSGPGSAPEQPPSQDPGASASGSGTRTAGYVVGAVGVAGVAVGAITGLMVLGKKSVADNNCDDAKRCNQTGADAADAGRTLGAVSTTGFIVGAVGLGLGAYLVLSSGPSGEATSALSTEPLPGGAGLRWLSRF
ncbi:MAG: hypothetical protein OZ921_03590 [Sorangiineae bacterium]|nr:hypothetical protein [Polyangiaceae bacterium]MEB2321572.1 hypothetical protein [Sorangiineae bacterium]